MPKRGIQSLAANIVELGRWDGMTPDESGVIMRSQMTKPKGNDLVSQRESQGRGQKSHMGPRDRDRWNRSSWARRGGRGDKDEDNPREGIRVTHEGPFEDGSERGW